MVKNFYFTFGYSTNLANSYVKIPAESWYEARGIMVEHHGKKWSMQYTEESFLDQIDKYDLVEVKIGTECYEK